MKTIIILLTMCIMSVGVARGVPELDNDSIVKAELVLKPSEYKLEPIDTQKAELNAHVRYESAKKDIEMMLKSLKERNL